MSIGGSWVRHAGALIRNKDDTTLTLAPTEAYERARRLINSIPTLERLQHVVHQPRGPRHLSASGPVAWAAVLDEGDLETFMHEFPDALLIAASGGPIEAIEDLLHDLRVTAQAPEGDDLVAELLEEADETMIDVEL